LVEEENRSTRLCLNYCYEKQVFIALSKIGQTGSSAVIRECIVAFSTLIENDENFLGHESFAHSLITFLQTTSDRSVAAFDGEFVELLFSIASKIRQNPEILRVWFTRRSEEGNMSGYENLEPRQRFVGITNKEDFPLFYLLIDYVHQEGKVGDFARTGLLYVVETASSSRALEQWIAESDLATLMASGLGALYSQLSRCGIRQVLPLLRSNLIMFEQEAGDSALHGWSPSNLTTFWHRNVSSSRRRNTQLSRIQDPPWYFPLVFDLLARCFGTLLLCGGEADVTGSLPNPLFATAIVRSLHARSHVDTKVVKTGILHYWNRRTSTEDPL